MTELQHYQQNQPAPAAPQNTIDSWISAMGDIAHLADYIQHTDFVPDAMKGKPAAVAAAILTGREMGLEPMTALRSIHVIKGKPGLSAELMRAQVLAAGHQIEFVENTDSRCVVAGKRRGETDWARVSFTADQAKKAKIELGGYPEDKLIARATSRLCRRKFADVVAGLTSVDELEDAGTVEADAVDKPQQTTTRRTAQRKAPAKTTPKPAQEQRAQPQQIEQTEPSGPPLPGEDDDDPYAGAVESLNREYQADSQTTPQERLGDQQASNAVTKSQLTKLGALFTNAGIKDRDQRLKVSSQIVARELPSSTEMTKAEASTLIDTLEQLAETGDLAQTVSDLVQSQDGAEQGYADDDPDVAAQTEQEEQ